MPAHPPVNPVAVVTGAARGIGLAIAGRFLADGFRVALLDIDGDTLAPAASHLGGASRVLAIRCDVSSPLQVQAAVGFPTLRLIRIAIGGVQLSDLAPGAVRDISVDTCGLD